MDAGSKYRKDHFESTMREFNQTLTEIESDTDEGYIIYIYTTHTL